MRPLLAVIIINIFFSSYLYAENRYSSIQKNAAYITIQFEKIAIPDSLTIFYWDTFYSFYREFVTPYKKWIIKSNSDSLFKFELPLNSPLGYFSLECGETSKENPRCILKHYLVATGDSVLITFYKSSVPKYPAIPNDRYYSYLLGENLTHRIMVTGPGSEKYNCRYAIDTTILYIPSMGRWVLDKEGNYLANNYYELAQSKALKILEAKKDLLKPIEYSTLLADISSKLGEDKITKICYHFWDFEASKKTNERSVSEFKRKCRSFILNTNQDILIPQDAGCISKAYAKFAILRQKALASEGDNIIQSFQSKYAEDLLDKILTVYLIDFYHKLQNAEEQWNQIFSIVQSNKYRELLLGIYNNQGKGKLAFDFALSDTSGKTVYLHDFKGKVVFIDFWYTGCGVCAIFNQKTIVHVKNLFKHNSEVVFVSISIDTDKNKWIKSINLGKYTTPDVINLYTNGEGMNHPIIRHYNIIGYPHQLLVDKQGKIYRSNNLQVEPDELAKIISEALLEQQLAK